MTDETARLTYAGLATHYEVQIQAEDCITVEQRSTRTDIGNWAVCRRGSCFTTEGIWEFEPMPSSRTTEYYKRARYDSLGYAMGVALTLAAKMAMPGFWHDHNKQIRERVMK